VTELLKILLGDISEWKYVWITEYKTDKKLTSNDMLWYFEVWILDSPQDKAERQVLIRKFKTFFTLAQDASK
jgi:hypothetical protein